MNKELKIYLFSMGTAFTIYSGALMTKSILSSNREENSSYKKAIVATCALTGASLIGAATLSDRNKKSKLEE